MSIKDIDIFNPNVKYDLCKGCLLVADPFLNEPYFTRSIILLTEYGTSGAMGFVVNKPSKLYPDEMIESLNSFNDPMYIGGPLSTDTLYFVHTLGPVIESTRQICPGLWWGGNYEMLWDMLNSGAADCSQVRFYTGYSGWSPGQLEFEIKGKNWIVSPMDIPTIFTENPAAMWGQRMRDLGDVYSIWANFPQHPQLN